MWPHKEGLGVRLSYGVDGNGLSYAEATCQNDPTQRRRLTPVMDFPRINGNDCFIREVRNSRIELVERQASNFSINSKMYDSLKNAVSHKKQDKLQGLSSTYIPQEILNSYLIESKTLTSAIAYDPTYGSLFSLFEIKSKRFGRRSKAISYVTGESGNILNLSLITAELSDAHSPNEPENIERTLTPKQTYTYRIALTDPIKQIEFPLNLENVSPYCIIRTSAQIFLLRCFLSSSKGESQIELEVIKEIRTLELAGLEFSDAAFNCTDYSKFAIVDVKGNFGVWKIPSDPFQVYKVSFRPTSCEATIQDPSELSNWKRIIWPSNNMLLASRSGVTELTIGDDIQSRKLITSNTWSRIQDFRTINKQAFLLTSKELIWFDLSKGMERILSWKHFLDDSDPSLKIQVTSLDDQSFICIVYSQMNPLIFIYHFGYITGRPHMLQDPYYIRRSREDGDLQELALYDSAKYFSVPHDSKTESLIDTKTLLSSPKFTLFELSTDFNLSSTSYSNNPNLEVLKTEMVSDITSTQKFIKSPVDMYQPAKRDYTRNQKLRLFKLIGNLMPVATELQIEAIQDYAFSVGEGIQNFSQIHKLDKNSNPSYFTLLEIADNVPTFISNVSEIDNMIEHLDLFCTEKGILMASLINHSYMKNSKLIEDRVRNTTESKSIEDVKEFLKNVYIEDKLLTKANSTLGLNKVAILIGSSLIKAKSLELSKHYSLKYEECFKTAPEKVQSILDSWENDIVGEHIVENMDSQATIPDIYSSMPTVKLVSQPKSKSLHRASSQESSLLPSFDLHSQQVSQQETQPSHIELSRKQSSQSRFSKTSQRSFNSSQVSTSQARKKRKKKGGFA